jgi:hypothetical protein
MQPLGVATITQIVGAAAVLVVATSSLIITIVKPTAAWVRWLLLLPPPTSLTAYQVELALLIAAAVVTGVFCALRTPAARIISPILAVIVIGVMVGNVIEIASQDFGFFSASDYLAYLFSQPESIATWLVCALVLACGLTGVIGPFSLSRVAIAWGSGAVVCAISATVAVTTAPGGGSLAALSGLDSDSSGSGSNTASASASANAPGSCAAGWFSDIDVTTANMQATVCSNGGAAHSIALRRVDGTEINALAVPFGAGWRATVGTETFDVSPDFIAIYDNGRLELDEAAIGSAASSDQNPASDFSRLAALVQIAHDGRLGVRRLQRLTLFGNCSSVSAATTLVRQVLHNREQLTRAAARLANDVSSAGLPVAQFERAMQYSLDADRGWSRWISGSWRRWVERGCSGSAHRGQGLSDLTYYSQLATQAKKTFVRKYDPIAAQHGRRSNWRDIDI